MQPGPVRKIVIVGGGTAGWLSAAYLARMLSTGQDGGIQITLVESPDIGVIGVGEGTFPSIRKTLHRIGVDEAELVRECGATFKQGIKFVDWVSGPGAGRTDQYFHPFQVAQTQNGLDLLPYWLLGVAGNVNWAEVNTVQKCVADNGRAPKLISHENYSGPLSYAYHFDAVLLARLIRKRAIELGVVHIEDTVEDVNLAPDGSIDSIRAAKHGEIRGEFYIDCTGFAARLIGQAMGIPFESKRSCLFANRAVVAQKPYPEANSPIASYTISTAVGAGWIWDIGLRHRRGLGYVYSSDHISDEKAAATLRAYAGLEDNSDSLRVLKFEAGYRRAQWHKNCVAIGLSSGFIEPLEATGIGFAEIAALFLAKLFPWSGGMEHSARTFNSLMSKRYDHVIDFIKLHYCLSKRRDSDFWRDNVHESSVSETLKARLEEWRYRPPDMIDVDLNRDIFLDTNWQYVLYGMGFRTDLSGRAGALKYYDDAKAEFASIRRQAEYALTVMPPHRDLIEAICRNGFQQRPIEPFSNVKASRSAVF
jgi:tryptophan halogenase